jgi:hypothetical protein
MIKIAIYNIADIMSNIQAVIFEKKYWDAKSAKAFLNSHKIRPIKPVHKTTNFLRYRLKDPKIFNHFITKKNKKIHLSYIVGFKQKQK